MLLENGFWDKSNGSQAKSEILITFALVGLSVGVKTT